MKVYMLSAHEYSDWTMLGIYSSREKAEEAKALYERPYRPYPHYKPDFVTQRLANNIEELELDKHLEDNAIDSQWWLSAE